MRPRAISNAGSLDDRRAIDGLDITKLLDHPDAASPLDAVGFYYDKNAKFVALRMDKWKPHFNGKPELYDLRADVEKSHNVADANPEAVAQLRKTAANDDSDLKAHARPLWRVGGEAPN